MPYLQSSEMQLPVDFSWEKFLKTDKPKFIEKTFILRGGINIINNYMKTMILMSRCYPVY